MIEDHGKNRRVILAGLLGGVAVAATTPVSARTPDARGFIARALAQRQAARDQGDQPYGAVMVKEGQVIAEAPSRVVTRRDPTAHAEMEAIREAARTLGTNNLAGCEMYSTSRPCPMCTAAAYWAGVSRLVWGEAMTDGGPPRLPPY